jgi:hypothetical protein
MKTIRILVALFLLVGQVEVILGKMMTVVDFEEIGFSNLTEQSLFDFTELRFKKINRTHHAMTGIVGVLKDIAEENKIDV